MEAYRQLIRPTVALGIVALIGLALVSSPLTAGQRQTPSPRADADTPDHWPRFRGPDSNPVSDNPNLPVTWSKTENVEWVADVPGVGWSSQVVWGTRVFLTAATSEQRMKPPSLGTEQRAHRRAAEAGPFG